jgi:hypothetical protein
MNIHLKSFPYIHVDQITKQNNLIKKMEISNIIYKVEDNECNVKKYEKRELRDKIDDILSEIASIKKIFTHNKQKHAMTLFSVDHEFTAQEYIEHYKALPSHIYGKDFLSHFDETVIGKLNY